MASAEAAAVCAGFEAGTEPVDESLHCASANGLAHPGAPDDDGLLYGVRTGGDGGGGMGDRRSPLTWREVVALLFGVAALAGSWATMDKRLGEVAGDLRTLSARVGTLDQSVRDATVEVRAHVQSDGHRVEMAQQEDLRRRLDAIETMERDVLRRPASGVRP